MFLSRAPVTAVLCIVCHRWAPESVCSRGPICPVHTCGCEQCEIDVAEFDAAETKRILDELINTP